MPWVKLDDQFPDHPKIMEAGPAAAWLYVAGLCYSARFLTDGFIPKRAVRKLTTTRSVSVHVERLLSSGLWKETADGYQIHDWADYNPSSEQVKRDRAKARERMNKQRSSGEVRANKDGSSASPSPSRPRTQDDDDSSSPPTPPQLPHMRLLHRWAELKDINPTRGWEKRHQDDAKELLRRFPEADIDTLMNEFLPWAVSATCKYPAGWASFYEDFRDEHQRRGTEYPPEILEANRRTIEAILNDAQ